MSGSSHPVIQLGLELLKDGSIAAADLEKYSNAFSSLGIDIDAITELKLAGLRSIFSDSSIASKYYLPCELDANKINYPDKDQEKTGEDLTVSLPESSSQNTLMQLERYGSFVATSADQQTPVYDLFKSVAAVHDCLEKSDVETDEKCLLVGCDFSGIQDTVYTISSKGALKTLRARSFMLELLTEHIIYEILSLAEAERHAVIYSGGGGFALLLPNKKGLKENIGKYGDILNEWAYSEFFGKLFIALDVLPFKGENLKTKEGFQTLRQEQSDNLDKQKRQKFFKQLDALFKPEMPKQLTVQTECQITRRDDLPPSHMFALPDDKVKPGQIVSMSSIPINNREQYTWASESCFRQFYLGDALIEAKNIYRYNRRPKFSNKHGVVAYLRFPNFEHGEAYYSVECFNNPTPEKTFVLNSWENDIPTVLCADYVRAIEKLPENVWTIEEEIAQEESRSFNKKNTATFEGLSASSCGADLIGALRMDVDNMGKLFADIGNLLELSAKSRMLNLFFKVYLNRICKGNLDGGLEPADIVGKKYTKKNKGRNVSVIYAGGDDLLILGAWDETSELAFDIQRCFALFTGERGISGGLTLHQPKFPLYQMARKSGEAEHVAKHDKGQQNKTGEKNRIALFYSNRLLKIKRNGRMEAVNKDDDRLMLSINWDKFNDVIKFVKFFFCYGEYNHEQIVLKELPNSFTYGLLDITYEWHEKHHLSFPHLVWLLKKHDKELKSKDFDNEDGLSYFKRNIVGDFSQVFPILHLPLTWIELLKRRG